MSPESGFSSISVVGRGRIGSAVAARLGERGIALTPDGELRLLCVPDTAIAEVAAEIDPGVWVAHMSGATPLTALASHLDRFSVHPLQTFVRGGGPGQFDGAWGAVSAETDAAQFRGRWLAETLGLVPFDLAEEDRGQYHAGAVVASNYLVTLQRAAAELLDASAVPPEALLPLIRGTIDNGFELTGPIARGDLATVERHLAAIRAHTPELEPMYVALAALTERQERERHQPDP
jgi:predicted short-subunit dehydrogenase-like oxidoreductase (DUF2520 family)